MKRKEIEQIADRVVQESPELVGAFHAAVKEEQEEAHEPDGRSRVQLRRDPVWLRPFQFTPGKSGNPSGRRPAKTISSALKNRLQEVDPESGKSCAELISDALARSAMSGNVFAAREIRETTEGLLSQKLELTGHIQVQQQLTTASTEELEQIIATYLAQKNELRS